MIRHECGTAEIYIGDDLPADIGFVVVFLKDGEDWIMGFHKERQGWELPGGHIERGESIADAAVREAYEETGAVIDNIEIHGYYVLENGHKTAITTGDIVGFTMEGLVHEMQEMGRHAAFPENVTYRDGLYDCIATLIAPHSIDADA